jgi:hypothetical protein
MILQAGMTYLKAIVFMINVKKRVDPTIALEGLCIIIKGRDKLELFNNSFKYHAFHLY